MKSSESVSGSEDITMMAMISAGRDGVIEAPFVDFQNTNRLFPIEGS